MNISLVLPNHNRAEALRLTLDSLSRQTCPPDQFEVIVVDQASTDGSRELVKSYPAPYRLRLVEQAGKYGISVARNGGMQAAESALVLILDADLIADPGLVEAHTALHAQHPGGLACGQVLPYKPAYTSFLEEVADPEGGLDRGSQERLLPFYEAFGGHLSLAVETFQKIGPWDAALLRVQDIEFACRAEQLGIPIYSCPKAISYHNHVRTLQDRLDYIHTISWWPVLYQRYPHIQGRAPLISRYEAIDWHNDPARRILDKIMVRIYAAAPLRWLFTRLLTFFDRRRIFPKLVKALFWRLYIGTGCAGFQEGLRRLNKITLQPNPQ